MLKKVAMHGDTNKLYATEISRSTISGGSYRVMRGGAVGKYFKHGKVILNLVYLDQISLREGLEEVIMLMSLKSIRKDISQLLLINMLLMLVL